MTTAASTALSEAQTRVVQIKTDNDDIVKYSGNPAELPGVRYETSKALRRNGAFTLLIKHNAARLKSGVICVEDLDTIPFVTQQVVDPLIETYSYERPCPDTTTRVQRMNDIRSNAGLAAFTGYSSLNAVPDKIMKLAIPNSHEVEVEALAFALTQLSVFEDRQHANELLAECEYDGRKLAPILDAIEAQATPEDIELVTGERNAFKEAGLRGAPLTFNAYRAFFKEFNRLEYRCPPDDRLEDKHLAQLVGTLFIKDPAHRQKWSDNLSQPVIRDHTGKRISGPPQTYKEVKALAEKILRGASVISDIDALGKTGSAGAVLVSTNSPDQGANAWTPVSETLLAGDPRKSIASSTVGSSAGVSDTATINVPKGDDGKYLYWAPPMSLCECGTPDGGRHIRYKWPCNWYRKDADGGKGSGGRGTGSGGQGHEAGGRGKGKAGQKGKGKGASLISQEQLKSALASIIAAPSPADAPAPAPAEATENKTAASKASSSSGKSSTSGQSCNIANYNNDTELAELLGSSTLRAELASFFADTSDAGASTHVLSDAGLPPFVGHGFEPSTLSADKFTHPPVRISGAELALNEWEAWPTCAPLLHDSPDVETIREMGESRPNVYLPSDNTAPALVWDVNLGRSQTDARARVPAPSDEPCVGRECHGCSTSQFHVVMDASALPFALKMPSDGALLADAAKLWTDGTVAARGSSMQQFAFDSVLSSGPAEAADVSPAATPHVVTPDLPIFRVPVDSGCTATCTNDLNLLVNVSECNEKFNVADGKKSKCTAKGDMPVLIKDKGGKIFRFVFKNVRYVPDFKYTLLSVKQIWRDHRINSLFADVNELAFPSGERVPFDSRFQLPVVTMVSEHMLSASIQLAKREAASDEGDHQSCVGFHNIKSAAHIARLPAAQASELLHRRCHLGLNKIRALPHVTADAPKILGSAPPSTCVHCAASQIRLAGHSGALETPDPEPGSLHLDLKGPFPLSIAGKYRYVAFFIDEHARYVFVEFLHDKSEVIEATKRVMAKFNAIVGTPVNDAGVALPKPRVRRLHRDHEGGLESRQFEAFRADSYLYSTTSAPHNHDLNPIAESIIRVISTLATAFKSQCGAPVGFWPELIRHAVDWHNSAPQAAVGSSTSDPQISPTQRFTLKQPKVMDLPAFGSRTVVLKPPNHQSKTTLSTRGWVGMFLGRSADAIGTYEVWVPSINRKVRSSSLTVDEEHFPWLGDRAHQPLTSALTTARFLSDHLGSAGGEGAPDEPSDFVKANDINAVPRPSLSYLSLFSGPYEAHRVGGLTKTVRAFGWDRVTEMDNDRELGGGWQDDLLNDARYSQILKQAESGAFDSIVVQFPCSTFSPARCFSASGDGGDDGPPPVRDADHPDGLPLSDIPPQYHRELINTNRLWDRTVEVMIAAYESPRRTTLILENVSDRSIPGTNQHMADISHGSLFATSGFVRLRKAIPNSSMCTFANCMLGAEEQKYITLWYTNDAAPILDKLNDPEYQCNHPPGSHGAIAGGRDEDGNWRSTPTGHYRPELCIKLAMAMTFARTGDPTPLPLRRERVTGLDDEHGSKPEPPAAAPPDADPATAIFPDQHVQQADPAGTPRKLLFDMMPLSPNSIASSRANVQTSPSAPSRTQAGAPRPSPFAAPRPSPLFRPRPSPAVQLGGGISELPRQHPVQDARSRAVRASTRLATVESIANRLRDEAKIRAARAERAARARADTIPEEDEDDPDSNAPYTSFGGTPTEAWGSPPSAPSSIDSSEMEATVAGLIFDSHFDSSTVHDVANLSKWFDFGTSIPAGAKRCPGGVYIAEASEEEIDLAIARGGLDDSTHEVLISVRDGLRSNGPVPVGKHAPSCVGKSSHDCLRADSPDAPERYAEAMARGPPWPGAISKEFKNHEVNESWEFINKSSVPRGRRIHKFVWVFKMKRDGSAKARLCVQGCTLEEGVDFDQTFAKPLRHTSARGLFAYAARYGCKIRSVDLVAAYLQGEFIDGEVIYCYQPPGSNKIGSDGLPMICVIKKPIYGIPQAGRRLQRKFFPWCRDVMGLRQLDDSDDAVFVWDDPDGKEKFALGIYVDNLQLVHSAEVDSNGDALDENSYYAKFMAKLREDWDVLDEGPMVDLLGIDCDRMADGSILIHQTRYVQKMLSNFAPEGPRYKHCSVPYSVDLPRLVIEALEGSSADAPAHPDLVRPYQRRVGALMYACTGTRPDLAYAVHQHCRCLSRPTPELMAELDRVFSYLYENQSVGIRFVPGDGTLHGAADASWEVRASTSGWVVYWHGAPLCWGSRRQKCTSLSSCESEIIALSEAAKDVVYLRKFTRGLVPDLPSDPTTLSTDNKAARDLSYNPEHHDRSKHIERRHFFVRDMVENHEIVVPLIGTKENDADFFTKPLPPKRFKFLRRRIMNLDSE